jgi:Tol biopolymer transport system component
VLVIAAAGGSPVEVAGGNSLNLSPAWLPRGRELLFVSNRDGGRDVYRVALESSGKPEGPPERLTTGLNAATISLTPDGRRLAYAAFAQSANVWALPIPAGGPVSATTARPITTGNQIIESFDVSRDGKWLAFDSDRNGNQDIFRVPLAGGETEQLTSDPADDFQPVWSPDGREVGFHTFRNGNRDLYVMSATGGEQRPVVATAATERDAGWSPDGTRMSYASDGTGRMEVYTIPRKGAGWGTPTQLTRNGGIFPVWSKDGRYLLYGWTRGEALVSSDGSGGFPLPMNGPLAGQAGDAFAYAWGADSRHALIVVSRDTVPFQIVWSVPVDGSPPRPLITFDDPYTTFGRGALAVHDSTIYFGQLRSESDIWMVELTSR